MLGTVIRFNYLTMPDLALAAAERLNLRISPKAELERIAKNWRNQDNTPPELAMRDFVEALMPEVAFPVLAAARSISGGLRNNAAW